MNAPTIAEYLLDQLQASGVDHLFGVPGDYVLGFYRKLSRSGIQHIGTTREDTAAFAADGYARCRGIGALAVTYGVGALNVVNAVAGAHAESSPNLQPLILVGDGAFQMTGTELSTFARLGLDPVVIVFNNHGYSTERFILEGPFNDIAEWRYERIGELIGPVNGYCVHTEDEYEEALHKALAATSRPSLINVHFAARYRPRSSRGDSVFPT